MPLGVGLYRNCGPHCVDYTAPAKAEGPGPGVGILEALAAARRMRQHLSTLWCIGHFLHMPESGQRANACFLLPVT